MEIEHYKSTEYMYNLSNDYLNQVDKAMLNYGVTNSLSIKYMHIIVQESKNINDMLHQNYNNFVYDIYHMVPTRDIQQLNYSINFDPQHQGTSNVGTGSMSLFLINEPLPGDLFTFYNSNEIFRIQNVRWHRTQTNTLKIYNVDFETAPMVETTLNDLRINTNWYWNNELKEFVPEEKYNQFVDLVKLRSTSVDNLKKYYNSRFSEYGNFCEINKQGQSFKIINSILKGIKNSFKDTRIKIITTPVCELSIQMIDQLFEKYKEVNYWMDFEDDYLIKMDSESHPNEIKLLDELVILWELCKPFLDESFNDTFKNAIPIPLILAPEEPEQIPEEAQEITPTELNNKPLGLLDIYLWMDNITGVHYSDSYADKSIAFDGRE